MRPDGEPSDRAALQREAMPDPLTTSLLTDSEIDRAFTLAQTVMPWISLPEWRRHAGLALADRAVVDQPHPRLTEPGRLPRVGGGIGIGRAPVRNGILAARREAYVCGLCAFRAVFCSDADTALLIVAFAVADPFQPRQIERALTSDALTVARTLRCGTVVLSNPVAAGPYGDHLRARCRDAGFATGIALPGAHVLCGADRPAAPAANANMASSRHAGEQ